MLLLVLVGLLVSLVRVDSIILVRAITLKKDATMISVNFSQYAASWDVEVLTLSMITQVGVRTFGKHRFQKKMIHKLPSEVAGGCWVANQGVCTMSNVSAIKCVATKGVCSVSNESVCNDFVPGVRQHLCYKPAGEVMS
jgi:hypothetical protein